MSLRRLLPALALAPFGFAAAPAQANFLCTTPDCLLPTTASTATGSGVRSNTATRFSIGVQWSFGASGPELTAALRRTETTPHQQVYGGQADVSLPINLLQPLQWPTIRLLGVAGGREVQGLGGVGLQFGTWAPLLAAGASGTYWHAGANFVFGQGLVPYVGVNAFSRAVAPTRNRGTTATYSCPTGYSLVNAASQVFGVSAAVTNSAGKTCLGAT